MPAPDTNPVFWERWEHLGFAVVLQACTDYAKAMQKLEKREYEGTTNGDHYNPLSEIGYYEKFFRSKYFCYICPKYDGYELYDILKNGGWRDIRKIHRYPKQATYAVYESNGTKIRNRNGLKTGRYAWY